MRYSFFLLFLTVLFIGIAPQISAAQSKSVRVSPKIGVWQLTGKDEEETGWTAQIRFTGKTNSKSVVRYKGYFVWRSSDNETLGREYFTGVFNKRTGRLILKGYSVKNVRGELGIGNYTGFVSRKGQRISRGSWGGEDVVKGNWSARWLKFR
jgi:hypothetical protein